MTKLTDNDVKKTAKLANLTLSAEEIVTYKNQLSEVINFVSKLDEVDTQNIEPTSQTTGLTNIYRQDEIDSTRILTQEEALSGTEKTYNGYFVVPMILTQKDE